MSKAMKTPPSAIIGIKDDFIAYAFNSAVVLWGSSFDAAVEEAVHGAKSKEQAESKQRQVVRRWIPSTRQYRKVG
jgi:hypothetical protein